MNTRFIFRVTLSAIAACATVNSWSAENGSSSSPVRPEQIAPFIDDATFVVIRFDPSKITTADPENMLKKLPLEGVYQLPFSDLRRFLDGFSQFIESCQSARAKSLYAIMSYSDVRRLGGGNADLFNPVLLAFGDAIDRKPLLPALGASCVVFEEHGKDCLVMGDRNKAEQFKNRKTESRPAWASASEIMGQNAFQVYFLPPAYMQKIVAEMMPSLPPLFENLSGEMLVEGMQWAAVGVDFQPEPRVRIVLQSKNDVAAEKMKAWVDKVLAPEKWPLYFDPEKSNSAKTASNPPDYQHYSKIFTPQRTGDRLELILDAKDGIPALAAIFRPRLIAAQQAAEAEMVRNNMRQIGEAMQKYCMTKNRYPDPIVYDKKGNPLSSWRVSILPFMEYKQLFNIFHPEEPWDAPLNKAVRQTMVPEYESSGLMRIPHEDIGKKTGFCFPIGPGTMFEGKEGPTLKDIPDPTHTIVAVEVVPEKGGVWTSPFDWKYDPNDPAAGLVVHEGVRGKFYILLFADGHADSILLDDAPPEKLREWFSVKKNR